MTVKRRDFQKASTLLHEFLLKLSEDSECGELRDSLNLALLYMQRYYRLLRSRLQHQQRQTTSSSLSMRGLSPMTPFTDTPDKFLWKWTNLENPKFTGTLPGTVDKEDVCRLPQIVQAAKVGDNDLLMQLIEKDPDCIFEVDVLGRNALMYAVHFGHLDTIQNLLENGTDVNSTTLEGCTVVHLACHDEQHEALEILISYGGNLEKADNMGRTPLHWACANSNTHCLKLLLENGASVNVRDNDGMTVSMWACRMDNISHIELLTSADTQRSQCSDEEEDGFERDALGMTWLHWAVRRTDSHECLKTLLTEDAANLRDKEGKTVIHRAAELGSVPATKIILEIGGVSCLNHRDLDNRTPLILATMRGHGEVVNCLLSAGADLALVDNYTATAWDYASVRQLHYCKLIIASFIRHNTQQETSQQEEEGLDHQLTQQETEESIDINQLQINGDEQAQYSSQPVCPHPPTQPVTPRTPRNPKHTPRPPAQYATNHAPSNPSPAPSNTHHAPTPTPRSQSNPHLNVPPMTPRAAAQKRSPSTPVEVREEEMLFERTEQQPGSSSKRMRGGQVPGSYETSHRTRPRSEPSPDEPEMPSNSEYVGASREDGCHGDEQESVSIDAMDVSDFDADIDDDSPRQQAAPQALPTRAPPTRTPPSRAPPTIAPPTVAPPTVAPPPRTPPPRTPPSRAPPTTDSPRKQQYPAENDRNTHYQSYSPHPPQYNGSPSGSYPPPQTNYPQPPHNQVADRYDQYSPAHYVQGPEDQDMPPDSPPAPVPTPRTQTQNNVEVFLPPTHLSPLNSGEQRRKKKKKRREKPEGDPHHNAAGIAAPLPSPGPLVHPPPPQQYPPHPTTDQPHAHGDNSHQGQPQGHSTNRGHGGGQRYETYSPRERRDETYSPRDRRDEAQYGAVRNSALPQHNEASFKPHPAPKSPPHLPPAPSLPLQNPPTPPQPPPNQNYGRPSRRSDRSPDQYRMGQNQTWPKQQRSRSTESRSKSSDISGKSREPRSQSTSTPRYALQNGADGQGPRESMDRHGPKNSPDRRGPRDSPDRRGPRDSPDRRGPRDSPDRRGPTDSPDRQGPREGPDRRGPQSSSPERPVTRHGVGGARGLPPTTSRPQSTPRSDHKPPPAPQFKQNMPSWTTSRVPNGRLPAPHNPQY